MPVIPFGKPAIGPAARAIAPTRAGAIAPAHARPPLAALPGSAPASGAAPLATSSAVALAIALGLAAADARAGAEFFRLAPGSFMHDDDSGVEGQIGYARGLPYEVVQGYAVAEGDMVLGRVDSRGRLEVPIQRRGLGRASLFERWPDGIVPYAFHPGITDTQRRNVEAAIEKINGRTRVELIPDDDPRTDGYIDSVLFEPSNGCASYVGRQQQDSRDSQALWVADNCSVGSIVHEISHAIGLYHEHTRPDRDNYIQVDWDRIVEGKGFNFEIYDIGAESWGEYDYGSIMHYGERFFSRDGGRTIVAPSNVLIGQRVALSDGDIDSIDRMYATDLALDVTTMESERGIEIDVSITNIGSLGARELVLRVTGASGTDWLSISAESGWDCLAHEEELHCQRDRLVEQASSRFTLIADAATTSIAAIGLQLDSLTLDLDRSNNVFNDEAFGEGTSVPTMPAPLAALPDTTELVDIGGSDDAPDAAPGSMPEIGAASGESAEDDDGGRDERAGERGDDDPSGGGGAGGPLTPLALLALMLGRRRRRA